MKFLNSKFLDMKKKLPKSIRKYIRQEKARIRREVLDSKKQTDLINELYKKYLPKAEKHET